MAIITEEEMEHRRIVNEIELAIIKAIPTDVPYADIVLALQNIQSSMIRLWGKPELQEDEED